MQKATLQLSVRLALSAATICMVFLMIGGSADAGVPAPAPVEYVVAAGDTLWEIAEARSGPGDDVRRLISEIAKLSGVEGGAIFPGQVLLIPGG
jgi:nucleoid-associated protein YgaU